MSDKLRNALMPLVSRKKTRIESFLEEDVDWYIVAVKAFHVEDKVIQYIKNHPNATAQELYNLLPEGLPPGDDGADLLEED